MRRTLGTNIGKVLQQLTRLNRSGGQALPGLVVEKIFPNYAAVMLEKLPKGVIVITGTNGKTTTTKIVVELLEASGQRVITNSTGSNLTRGIVSSLAQQASWNGHLPYDIAVFEIDEAFAKQFVNKVKPRWTMALNVSRDQLDRFGEVDRVAELAGVAMKAATHGVITNANDPRLVAIAETINRVPVHYFSVAPNLRHFFPTDNEMVSVSNKVSGNIASATVASDVELTEFHDQQAVYLINGKSYRTTLQLTGQHNFQNAAAALALARQLIDDQSDEILLKDLSEVSTAFGRGEKYSLKDGGIVQLVLVKNPASFRQTLASYLNGKPKTMIVINDKYADSRDVSWLWDVDFASLNDQEISITSGSRAADMALRLYYDDIKVDRVEPNIDTALQEFLKFPGEKVILATYTAMLYLHDKLKKKVQP